MSLITIGARPNLAALRQHFTIHRSNDGQWIGCTTVHTPGGPVKLCAYADEKLIVAALTRAHQQLHALMDKFGVHHEAVSGGFFSLGHLAKHFGHIASDIAHGHVKAALREGSKIATEPLGELKHVGRMASDITRGHMKAALREGGKLAKDAVDVTATVIPGVGLVKGPVMQAGASLLSRVRRGDPKAREIVQSINQLAAQGNPNAQGIQKLLGGILRHTSGGGVAGDPGPASRHGQWVCSSDGSHVFVPAAFAGGAPYPVPYGGGGIAGAPGAGLSALMSLRH